MPGIMANDAPPLPILLIPDPRLRARTRPVGPVDAGKVRDLSDRMLDAMYKAPGIGLAAPQVGVSERLVVLDVADGEERPPMTLVNPELVWRSSERGVAAPDLMSALSDIFEGVPFLDRQADMTMLAVVDEEPLDRDQVACLYVCASRLY